MFFLVGFDRKIMQLCEDTIGPGLWEPSQGPLTKCQAWLSISFGGIGFFSMEKCAPFVFLGSWVLMAMYLCYMFHTFDKPILEEYVY